MNSFFKILSILLLGFISIQTYAQQDPQYTMYMFNQLAVNPGYAGSRGCLSATAHYRTQWVNIDGAPRTLGFGLHSPLRNEKVGLGLQVVNDQLGVTNSTNIAGIYSYRLPVSDKGTLSIGLQAVITNYVNDLSKVTTQQADQTFSSVNNQNLLLPNFGTGIYYTTGRFYLGATIPHLINNKLEAKSNNVINTAAAKQFRHLFLMSGIVVDLTDDVKFKPSVLLKYAPNSPAELDANASFLFVNALWLGATWRSDFSAAKLKSTESIDFMAIYELNQNMRAGMAYDMTMSDIRRFNKGTYEFLLGYDFDQKRDKILTPRYF